MRFDPIRLALIIAAAIPAAALAQELPQAAPADPAITVNGSVPAAALPAGPEIKGIISARHGDKLKVTSADGTATVITITEATRIKGSQGLFGTGGKFGPEALLNGLPVAVKTLQAEGGLVAGQITFKGNDLKMANMIRNGTSQQFDEQTAATQALRGRMADIDKYNIKSTANVYFDSGKAVLSARAKADLCATAATAEATENALMLVVGYTDSTGSDDVNQALSEKRAGSVINYLQQACHWKPWRMLTPTGMATADPLASNDTPEGKAQNRRVAVNVLVSKSVDGM
ncbi:MAG: OmpA family protein [Sphingomonadales bacterium]|nr:OmpA family protein [Sphingomonadales bacterium]